ncbi:DUF551 domain-containing protein [Klebsiella pneumoniae]|uniref:DUF551 domain-containing protein n=1 Tax=Klebsiella pneumoniae TaxID=573 RepID=UPI001D0EACE6|nr:DUF551 domain-containing protein [Klebsiella pneumoniae]
MTSKLTRERLEKIKSWRETYGAGSNVMLPAEEAEELACLALAAMDSEPAAPVAEIVSIYGDPEAFGEREIRPLIGIQQMPYGTKLYRHAQPVENHIGSKNALDAIVSFIKSKSNPTVKCYEEVSEQLFKDNCHGIHSHVIEYILKLGEELEDLRTEQDEVQPEPVVPEKFPAEIRDLIASHSDALFNDDDAQEIWNACRAAMLQELKKSAGTEAICRSDENVQVLHTNSPAQSDCCPAQNHVSPEQNGDTPAQSQGWIPVSERIPDNTEPVLCIEKRADFGTYGQPFVCWHDGGGWVGKTNYRPIVTHWMPLPAAPQEVIHG